MRIKVLIMSSLLLLALFATKSYSVDWNNPDGQSADDLLSNDSDNIVSPSYTQEVQASRAAQIEPLGNDILSTPLGNKLYSGTMNPRRLELGPEPDGRNSYSCGRGQCKCKAYNVL